MSGRSITSQSTFGQADTKGFTEPTDSQMFPDAEQENYDEKATDKAFELRWGASREQLNSLRNTPQGS